MNKSLQLTIRGLDPATKKALVKKASQQGVSLNRYALNALQQSADLDNDKKRYQTLKKFLNTHSMQKSDQQAFDEAIAYSDKTSLEKQRNDISI